MASAITHPSSGYTHPRLLVDPLDGTLVCWLANPMVGAQMLPLAHSVQRVEDKDEDEDSWVH